MFKNNKYTTWYMKIISNAKNKVNERINGYFEEHHIVPRKCGGLNTVENLVKLTAREHFLCHVLLVKMLDGQLKFKMAKAAHCMMYLRNDNIKREYKITSRIFSFLREEHALAISDQMKGKSKSEEHRRKIREALTGRKFSQEHIEKLSEAMLARIANGWVNPWAGAKGSEMSSHKNKERALAGTNPWAGEKGSQLSKEICAKQLEAGTHPFQGEHGSKLAKERNKKLLEEGKHLNQLEHTCPHCGKTGKGRTMFRWHFKNCSKKLLSA